MKLRILFIAVLALSSFHSFAQSNQQNTYYAKPDSAVSQKIAPQKVHFGMQIGTSVSTNFRGGASLSTFVSPYLSYRVSPRWRINAGASIVNSSLAGFNHTYGDSRNTAFIPQQSTFLFLQGQYQASERLVITGTSFYETSRFNQSPTGYPREMNSSLTHFNSKGGSIYAEYKVSEHFSFGIGAQFSNGNTPYYNNGFGGSRWGSSSFGNSAFSHSRMW
ncbi:MAG: hypothetical protein V4714_16760 [Bacteroidota bacterium]